MKRAGRSFLSNHSSVVRCVCVPVQWPGSGVERGMGAGWGGVGGRERVGLPSQGTQPLRASAVLTNDDRSHCVSQC